MRKRNPRAAFNSQAYRRRMRATGCEEVLFQLPHEVVDLLDRLKQRQGLRNRSLALLQLITDREATTQQQQQT